MQIQVRHPVLREFFDSLQASPRQEQQKYLANAEKLQVLIDPQKEYPFDFVVFRLTGRRVSGRLQDLMLPGAQLLCDLRVFTTQVSRRVEVPVADQKEPVYTVSQLAERFSVSDKTIRRWQKRGLGGMRYLFPDGRKRVGFTASSVEMFAAANPDILRKGGRFTRVREEEKKQVVDLARTLCRQSVSRCRDPILREVANRLGRSRETVRSIIQEHDQAHPDKAVFARPFGRLNARERAGLYKMYQQKAGYRQLMERFGLSQSSIHRIVNQQRVKELFACKIEYIDSPQFHQAGAEEEILGSSETLLKTLEADPPAVLTRAQETELFRRYNFLKFLAFQERSQIQSGYPSSRRLDRVQQYLAQAEQTQHFLVEINMPLVVSIAGKHLQSGALLGDLVSEGNLSLMRAVEKFDYTKGYRFSTYATLAIAKDFARQIPAEAGRPDRAGGSDFSQMAQQIQEDLPDLAAVEQAQRNLHQIIMQELDERERYVVLNRFPLGEGVIPAKPKTLKEIGDGLGITKERVRQIELQALQKLRHMLSPEQFDLLTG
jgi:RNA polymerase sigma factor (sigma-70 family)